MLLSCSAKLAVLVLNHLGMDTGKDGEKRTLYSLRHTAIIFNLQYVDRTDIEKRADTSPEMISNWYYPASQLEESLEDLSKLKKKKIIKTRNENKTGFKSLVMLSS